MWGWQTSNSSLLQILHSSMSSERGIGLRGGGGPGKYVGGQFGERRKCDRVSFLGLSTVLQKICAQKNPGSLWSPKAEKFEFLLLHSVLSGGGSREGGGGRRWKDFGYEVLTKIPVLYEVPKLRNLNFCCCTVCFLGRDSGGGGGERTMGLRSSQKSQVSMKS